MVRQLTCKECLRLLDTSEFYKARNTKNGHHSVCKECYVERVQRSKYKLNREDLRELKAKDHCDLCKRKIEKKINKHIDHCHKTGRVRGVLCRQCNLALGWLKDDTNLIYRIITYLKS